MNDAKQQAWPWPNSLDALAAAPDHHTLLMENERVRMLETRIAPGDKTLVHTHCWLCVYHIMSWSDFIRYDDRGNVMLDSHQVEALATPPQVLWSEALPPHALENIDPQEIYLVSVELKNHTTA